MQKTSKRALKALAGFGQVLTLAAAPLLVQQVLGLDSQLQVSTAAAQESKYETTKTLPIRQAVSKELGKVQKKLEAEDWRGALAELKAIMAKRTDLNGNEKANVYNFMAYAQLSLEDFTGAISSYKKVSVAEGTSPSLKLGAMKYLGQLYMQQGNWDLAIKTLKEWMGKSEIVGSDTYYLLSQCYYQKSDYKSALSWVSKAVDNYTSKGKVPRESWYSMQAALYYETSQVDKAIKVFETLIKHYNKPKYWKSVAGMYGLKERSNDQLHAMETVYLNGELKTESELKTLSALYMQADVPYKAAKILDKGIKDGIVKADAKSLQAMGNAYSQAQEKKDAISALEKAAKKSDEGKIYYHLGAIYLDDESYEKAERVLRSALNKGGLRSTGMAQLYLGQALFYLNKFNDADKYLSLAVKDKKSKDAAIKWKKYMANEIKRREALKI